MLNEKKIIVGITGGIAAYKTVQIVRLLVKYGAEVKVIMTPSAHQFVTPLTLATLSKNPVVTDFFDATNGQWNSHVDLGLWADAFLIAPATANTLGKLATGTADNLLIATYLAAKCPVFIAPAMDLHMYAHPTTRQNLETLKAQGNLIIDPVAGELASGLEGRGRMEEPENIVRFIQDYFVPQNMLGKKILITAGPTFEKIDPVRFIGNYSSGKMGFALAETCARRGADVILVCGPVHLKTPYKNIERINVDTAADMYKVVMSRFEHVDGAIMCAAVSDFTPVVRAEQKMKRGKENIFLELTPSIDIAAEVGKLKKPEQFLVGFALETNHEEENAISKMERKNFDFIVLNSLRDPFSGFVVDTNKVTILHRSGMKKEYELKDKVDVADDIVQEINTLLF
ncbi:MAG: bifunctional phosphopantothenoylcysteine decarboxylase/phosphopantothenate--cysteine ligase CoaBC [Paludibacter sp.]|nr:bifunctional phosphopantothenoylcysteine decarboxylase/phosphopantothenate--cysteine ligase CoaBC [Bacteroidales bacterium]